MIRYNYAFTDKRITDADEFAEASASELRVLLSLIDLSGECSDEELTERSRCTKARVTAALALWEEAGVIRQRSEDEAATPYGNKITEEFPERVIVGELGEQSAKEVAKTIRDHKLASLFDECALMIGKPMLTPMEIKSIAGLCSQYALSDEYIAMLAAHLSSRGKLSVGYLTLRAKKLAEDGIATAEELQLYISEKEARDNTYMEFRRLLGIFDRNISPTERKYFSKWSTEFGFDTEIVGMAYDISVINTSKLSMKYMDTLLVDWHEHGCKTVGDCERRYEAAKLEREAEQAQRKAAAEDKSTAGQVRSSSAKKPKDKPRYGNFDPEDALRRAIERSYVSKKIKSDADDTGDKP